MFVVALAAAPARADRLILRNLTIVSDKTVASFDEDGVRLADGGVVGWDEIERGAVSPDKQAAFDQMLKELGGDLYRIRQRLSVEDYVGLLPHAEAVYPRYRQRRSQTAYMVCQAVMWGRLAARRREEAVEPYWRCYDLLRLAQGKNIEFPGKRRLQFDLETGLTPELLPVWFDAEAAKKVLDELYRTIGQLNKPLPEATRIYFGTLALAAGDEQRAATVLRGFSPMHPTMQQLRDAALAQQEALHGSSGANVAQLESTLASFAPATQPVALYWIGRAKVQSPDLPTRQEGMLQLLRIAALYGDQHPELAAAGLFYTMEALKTSKSEAQSQAVRKELLERYGQTYFAARVKEPKGE